MTLGLTRLLDLIEDLPAFRQFMVAWPHRMEGKRLILMDAAKSYLIAALYWHVRRPFIVVTARPEHAKQSAEQLSVWTNITVKVFRGAASGRGSSGLTRRH